MKEKLYTYRYTCDDCRDVVDVRTYVKNELPKKWIQSTGYDSFGRQEPRHYCSPCWVKREKTRARQRER